MTSTAPLVVVHQGTVTIEGCDLNGGPSMAIDVPADTGHATVTITNCDLGADLLDTDGNIVTDASPADTIVRLSQPHQASANRVSATVSGNRFSKRTDDAGGVSVRYGTTDSISIATNVYKTDPAAPATLAFEDYPTIIGAGGVAPRMHAGVPTVKTRNRIVIGAGVPPRMHAGTPAMWQTQFVVDAGDVPTRMTPGVPRVIPGRVKIIVGAGVAPRMHPGVPTVVLEAYPIRPVAVPQRAVFGRPLLNLQGQIQVRPTPQRAIFGVTQVVPGAVTLTPVAIPQRRIFGAVSVVRLVYPVAIPQRRIVGTPTIVVGAATVRPRGVPQRRIFGVTQVVLGAPVLSVRPVPQRAIFGVTKIVPVFGVHEEYGAFVGF